MYIYKTTNIVNKKIYIGQTKKPIDSGYIGSGPILLKAIKKYGKENFIKETIEICKSKDQLNEREIYWIKFYNSTNRKTGYNISTGGEGGNLGIIVNKKISEARKGMITAKDRFGNIFSIHKDDVRFLNGELFGIAKGVTPHNKGVPMPEEQKKKLRKPKSEEHCKNLSKAKIGKNTKKIICLNSGIIYNSIKEAGQQLNLTVPNIVAVLKDRAKKTKGHSFKYI